MKRHVLALILLVMTPVLFAQSPGEQEIQAAEQAWADSYQACDVATMETLLSDDLTVITHTTGGLMDRQAFLTSMDSCAIVEVTNTPDRIRVYGDAAAVQGTSMYGLRGGTPPISVIYTRVWVKTNGQWQIVNHQSTGLVTAEH